MDPGGYQTENVNRWEHFHSIEFPRNQNQKLKFVSSTKQKQFKS